MSDLDDFTAQLNAGGAGGQPQPGPGGPGGPPRQGPTPEQIEAMKKAEQMRKEMEARPLTQDDLKGKIDIKWFGHAGFKIHFLDKDNEHRNIYIDIWIDNKDCPEEEKKVCPNDADLALVSHGQLDHSMHAPFLIMAGKREKRSIVCTSEVGGFYELFRKIPPSFITKMQKGGTKDFDFCKITMVHADHPSTCVGPQGLQITGGDAVGFIIEIPHHNVTFYHAGDTNVFSDMKLIDELYKPNAVFLPVGDCLGMGPREAAYAVKNFMPTPT
jgi:L-ascorbate metabolism protein UlaG (beta-lactamase superfamily)